MKQKLRLMMTMLLLAVMGSVWAEEVTLTNANIVSAGTGATGYKSWLIKDGNNKTWNAYAIKNQHSNATSSYHYLQIKKYASNTAYYIQVPEYGTKITSITMTVSSTSQPMTGGGNSATLYFSSSNTTSAGGTGVASGSGSSSVTIDCSSLNLNTGFITASGAVRIWDIKVVYENGPQIPTVATPTFTPSAGEVTKGTVVSFNCATEGVTYYYTTDDTTPTTSSASRTSYTVNADVTLKVIAVKVGMENSAVATASYTVLKNDPELAFSESRVTANIGETFTPPTLSYAEGYNGTITYSSSNSAITVNASTGEVSYGASAVGKTTTITATASETTDFKGGTASYVLSVVDPNLIEGNLNNTTFGTSYNGTAAGFTSATGTINDIVTVTYSRGTSTTAYINDNEIRLYNGSTLTFSVPEGYYIKSLVFDQSMESCNPSVGTISGSTWIAPDEVQVTTVTFTGTATLRGLSNVKISLAEEASAIAKPTITPSSGTYTTAQTVTITNNAEGATIYYTTDGSVPTASSTVYSKPFELSANGTYTIKAIAINGDEKSSVVTSNIVIKVHVDAPVFAEEDGTSFTEPYTIHLTSAQGTTIYYTTGTASPIDENGNLTADAKVYNATTGIANLTKAITITAVAIDKGGNHSETVSASYTYSGTVNAPYYENFDEGLGMFTVESSGTSAPEWTFRTSATPADIEKYGEARRYAFVTGNNNKRGTSRLISPVIDLTEADITSAALNFIHAGRFFDGYNSDNMSEEETAAGNAPTHAQLFIREEGRAWQQLTIPNWFTQTSTYTRRNSGEISLDSYIGKKVQVSFLYTADESSTGTWNVLKFAVTATKAEEEVNYETVNMKTDGYITYVVKNDIDWDATMKMNAGVYGYKVIQFTEAAKGGNGTTVLVELGNNVEMAVDEEKTELTDEQRKPLWSEKITPAGTPIILKGHAGDNLLVIAKSDDVIPSVKGNLLKPSFGDVQGSSAQTLYVLQKTSDWVATDPYNNYLFYKLANGRQIPDRKAYLNGADASEEIIYYLANKPDAQGPDDPASPHAKQNFIILSHTESEQLVSEDAGIPDGIEAVSGDNETKDRVFYSISGVKVSNPTKGIYILNGKKVIVK